MQSRIDTEQFGDSPKSIESIGVRRSQLPGISAHYRSLAHSRPNVYLPSVALTLNNLGVLQRIMYRLEDAEASSQESLTHYRLLAANPAR